MSWTREQYDAMQEKAHSMGYHLLTPYLKGLKNIRVGVITAAKSSPEVISESVENAPQPPSSQVREKQ